MVARVSVNDHNSTVCNTRFQSTKVCNVHSIAYMIFFHFQSSFGTIDLTTLSIGMELEGPAFNPWLDEG